MQNEKVNEFSTVKNTINAYNGHVAQGVAFLKKVVKDRQENGEGIMCSLGILTDKLEKAFDSRQIGILRWRWKDGYWNIVDNHRNQIKTTHTHKNQSKEFLVTEPQNQELVYGVLLYICVDWLSGSHLNIQ